MVAMGVFESFFELAEDGDSVSFSMSVAYKTGHNSRI